MHARSSLALHVDFLHSPLIEEVIDIAAAQRSGQGRVDITGGQAQRTGLAVVDGHFQLRRIVQAVAAHAQHARVPPRQVDKLLACRDQRLMSHTAKILELHIETRALPQPAHRRRLHDKHACVANACQRQSRPLRHLRCALPLAGTLAPVFEFDEGPGGVLAVATHPEPGDADQRFDFRLFEHVGLELPHHRLRTAVGSADRQLDLRHQRALVLIRQKRRGQADITHRHSHQHQHVHQQSPPAMLDHTAHTSLVTVGAAVESAVEPAEKATPLCMQLSIRGFEHRCAQRRCQGHRNQYRKQHGRNDGH
ncbi:hypothetical protein ALO98_200178 [Pseudomonas syringae pv. tagetis]|nr:hypothetical protein ALO98_200178 [Pseudomonas syringae pv. tagetis]